MADQVPPRARPPADSAGLGLRLTEISWLAMVILSVATPTQAPPPVCDEALLRLAAPVNGYRLRGDRCEGAYARQVSGTTIFLASFTQGFEEYRVESPEPLILTWPSPTDSAVRVRAETVRPGRYYRMDTSRPPHDTLYSWPSQVLSAERIRRRELGLLSWTRFMVGREAADVYLPLRVRQFARPSECDLYELVLSPGQRLKELKISLTRVTANGQPGVVLKREEPLDRGFYPAGSPILVRLRPSDFPESGIYRFTAAADLSPAGIATRSYLLYIAAERDCRGQSNS